MRTLALSSSLLVALVSLAAPLGCASPTSATSGTDGGGSQTGADARVVDAPVAVDAGSGGPAPAVSIIVEPNGNRGQELVSAIAAAHASVYVTMYELDNADVLTALTGRAQAGVDVQVVLDSSSTNKTFNATAYSKLTAAGAKVVWSSSRFTYTHEKCVIIDGATAWIMTMNLNTSSVLDNREFLAIDTTPADVAEATAVFQADHALQSITPSGPLVVANTNARPQIVALINSATSRVDLEGEEFSDTHSAGVVDAVAAAAQRGVTVHVVIANGNLDATSVQAVKTAGGHVVMAGPTSSNGTPSNPYIHAKAIVVDGARAFIGSENFTAGSLGYNRELGVLFSTASEVSKVKAAIDNDFAHGTPQ